MSIFKHRSTDELVQGIITQAEALQEHAERQYEAESRLKQQVLDLEDKRIAVRKDAERAERVATRLLEGIE